MPKIINAYSDANGSVADSLKDLGESMFGNQAKNALIREGVTKGRRQNDAAERGAQAFRDNNQVEMGAQGFRYNPESTSMGAQNLARQSIVPGMTADSPELGVRQIGAKEPASSTFMGEREKLKNARDLNDMTTRRMMEQDDQKTQRLILADEQKAGRDLVTVYGVNGPEQITRAEAMQRRARGEKLGGAPLHLDQVRGTFLERYYGEPTGSSTPSVATTPVRRAPSENDARAMAGLPHRAQEQVETDERLNAPIPPAPTGDPTQSTAAQQAADTTGLVPAAQHHANAIIGAIPGGQTVLNATTGSPQIGADQENARSQQDLRNNGMLSTLAGMPGRTPVFAMHLFDKLTPKGPAIGNPATEAQHVANMVAQLQTDRLEAAMHAQNAALPPPERAKYLAHVQVIDGTLRKLLAPQGAAPQAGAPATAAPEYKMLGNVRYFKDPQTGQWMAP